MTETKDELKCLTCEHAKDVFNLVQTNEDGWPYQLTVDCDGMDGKSQLYPIEEMSGCKRYSELKGQRRWKFADEVKEGSE